MLRLQEKYWIVKYFYFGRQSTIRAIHLIRLVEHFGDQKVERKAATSAKKINLAIQKPQARPLIKLFNND